VLFLIESIAYGTGPHAWFNTDLLEKGGSSIGGTITTIVIIGFGVVGGLTIFAYAFCITFLPLLKIIPPFKTIQDNFQVLKERGEQRVETPIDGGCISLFDACLGFTMLDGDDHVAEKVSVDER